MLIRIFIVAKARLYRAGLLLVMGLMSDDVNEGENYVFRTGTRRTSGI